MQLTESAFLAAEENYLLARRRLDQHPAHSTQVFRQRSQPTDVQVAGDFAGRREFPEHRPYARRPPPAGCEHRDVILDRMEMAARPRKQAIAETHTPLEAHCTVPGHLRIR